MNMQGRQLKYVGNAFIEHDLRRLKKLTSLSDDLHSVYEIISGLVEELQWPPPYSFCGGLIAEIEIDGERYLCFKDRVPIKNPSMSPSNGCRLVYALGVSTHTFIPLLVYSAKEEKETYNINNKKYSLTSSNLGKIINEKLK